ncbi:MAG: hypothetical protein NTV51_11025 [Verrucomicrobia bacterium]|nr:hypothetical protein [Verrucomicrobiota bacterium]
MHPAGRGNFARLNPRRIKRITILLLVLGFGSAIAIFLTARPVVVDPLIGDPMTSKRYVRELRVIGGKANVVAAEFMAWFAERWQGRNLAATVAVLTVVGTLAFRFVAFRPDLYAPFNDPSAKPPSSPP